MNTYTNSPVCLVTGSGSGRVGADVIRYAARHGYRTAIHYNTSKDKALLLANEVSKEGAPCDAFQADLTVEKEVENLIESIWNRFGRIDVVANCASTWLKKSLRETKSLDLLSEFSNNTLSTFLVSKLAGLRMAEQHTGGSIVLIADWAVARPYCDHSAYFVSKGSLATMTRVLAVELGSLNANVRVNCISPGPVLPPDEATEKEIEELSHTTLVKKIGGGESIARAVFGFVENPFITGVDLAVDGGRTIYSYGEAG